MTIFICADKYGIEAMEVVISWLQSKDLEFVNLGTLKDSDSISIIEFIPKVAKKVLESTDNRGIMICGTGIGVDIGANRFKGIRSVLASSPKVAEWSIIWDNANVLCLSGNDFSSDNINQILDTWFTTKHEDLDGSKNKFLSAFDTWS